MLAQRPSCHSEIDRNAHLTGPVTVNSSRFIARPAPLFLFKRLMASMGYVPTCRLRCL